MIKESQILYEEGNYWILEVRPEVYQVMVKGLTHSTCDSAYADFDLALARCKYLARREREAK